MREAAIKMVVKETIEVKKKRFDKSKEQRFKFRRFGHFTRECNANKKEPQGDEVNVVRQEFDEEYTLLVMITEEECNNNRLRDSSNNNFGNTSYRKKKTS